MNGTDFAPSNLSVAIVSNGTIFLKLNNGTALVLSTGINPPIPSNETSYFLPSNGTSIIPSHSVVGCGSSNATKRTCEDHGREDGFAEPEAEPQLEPEATISSQKPKPKATNAPTSQEDVNYHHGGGLHVGSLRERSQGDEVEGESEGKGKGEDGHVVSGGASRKMR